MSKKGRCKTEESESCRMSKPNMWGTRHTCMKAKTLTWLVADWDAFGMDDLSYDCVESWISVHSSDMTGDRGLVLARKAFVSTRAGCGPQKKIRRHFRRTARGLFFFASRCAAVFFLVLTENVAGGSA